MKKFTIFITIIFIVQSAFSFGFKEEGYNWNKVRGDKFERWIRQTSKDQGIPSLVVAKIDLSSDIKYYDTSSNLYTQFDIASLTKTFTTIGILQLVEQGKLSLNDPIWKYLPSIRVVSNYNGVSKIKHLLTHTSGIQYQRGNIVYQCFQPEYKYAYSNTGFTLLKDIIENVSKKSYAEYMNENIFKPLEMNNTHAKISNGTSGIITTIVDLANYTKMLLNKGIYKYNQILSPLYFDIMFNKILNPKQNFGKNYYWSSGWEVGLDKNKEIEYYHKAGRWYNSASGLIVYPEKNIAYIYLSNTINPLNQHFLKWRSYFMSQFDTSFENKFDNTFIARR